MADLPGIIEDAHLGKGLGIRFLRHIERNSVLLFVVSAESDDINKDVQVLINELRLYNPELLDKKMLLAISKADMLDEIMISQMSEEIDVPMPYLFISGVSGYGLDALKDKIWAMINDL